MDNYQLDSYTVEYLQNTIKSGKIECILNTFNTIFKLNEQPLINITIDTSDLESDLADLIAKEDMYDRDNFIDNIEELIKSNFLKYLQQIGIFLTEDPFFYVIEDIYNALYTALNLDHDLIGDTLEILKTDEEEEMILSNLLVDYSTLTSMVLYEIIDDVTDEFLENLITYYSQLKFLRNPDIDADLKNDIEVLLSKDNLFGISPFVNMCINKGYEYVNLEENLTTMYNNLNKMSRPRSKGLAYEIVAVLYLSSDSRLNMLEAYKDDIDLTHIERISDVTDVLEELDKDVIALIRKVNG